MRGYSQSVPAVLLVSFLAACGSEENIQPELSKFKTSVVPRTETTASSLSGSYISNLMTAGSSLGLLATAKDTHTALNFAAGMAVNEWVIKVDGCKSKWSKEYSSTIASPREFLELYPFDEGCQAGLASFSTDGKRYVKVGGGVLTGEAGRKANFKDEVSGSELTVSIGTQLASPLTDASFASFEYYTSRVSDKDPMVDKGIGIITSIAGVEAPNFEILAKGVDYPSMPDGIPQFRIKFECQAPMNGGNCPTPLNKQQPVTSMSVKIVADTFNGRPTYAQAEGVFATSPGITLKADSTIGTNGGVVAQPLPGPGPLTDFLNLMVFIRYQQGGGSSYTAYRLRVGDPKVP